MRFRLGCHDLPIAKGRQQGIPRDQRICTRCSLELVGDEHHLLFTCPAVQHEGRLHNSLASLPTYYLLARMARGPSVITGMPT
eukprot:jgi/Botrbrau1/10622/Bobra.154_1s0012.1